MFQFGQDAISQNGFQNSTDIGYRVYHRPTLHCRRLGWFDFRRIDLEDEEAHQPQSRSTHKDYLR